MNKKKKVFTICLSVLLALTLIMPTNAEAATKVKLNKTKITLNVGKTANLKLKGAKVKKWSSSNKKVATVSSKGKVKAKKEGTATIKAKAKNGKTYKCKVTVKEAETNNSNTEIEKQIVEIFERTFRAAGFIKTTDVMTTEEIAEWGSNGGMGYGDVNVSLSNVQEKANASVDFMNVTGYNMFYIEVIGMSDSVVTLRLYKGNF